MLRTNGAFRNLGEDTMASILLLLSPRDIAHLIVACVAAARCAASVLSPSLRPLVSITLRIFLLGATARTPRCPRALARRVIDFDFLRRYMIFEQATAEGCAFLAQLCPSPRITVGDDVTQVDKDVWTLAGQRGAERMTRICAFGEVQHYVGERGAERKVREQYLHGTAVRHYEGERGAECKVRVTYRSGTVVHFEGERGVEREVRIDFPSGTVWHLEGERDAERRVRIEISDGTVWHYEGERGAEHMVRAVYLDGTVEHFEGERHAERKVRTEYPCGNALHY